MRRTGCTCSPRRPSHSRYVLLGAMHIAEHRHDVERIHDRQDERPRGIPSCNNGNRCKEPFRCRPARRARDSSGTLGFVERAGLRERLHVIAHLLDRGHAESTAMTPGSDAAKRRRPRGQRCVGVRLMQNLGRGRSRFTSDPPLTGSMITTGRPWARATS